jgi:uncharacterized Zn-finger protein
MPVAARHFKRNRPVWVGLLLWLIHMVTVLGGLVALGFTFIVDPAYGKIFVGFAIGFVVILALRWIHSSSVSCPLCHGRILHGSKCHKHRDARRLGMFGYTSTLFVDIVLSGKFTCMYCGTPFRLKR